MHRVVTMSTKIPDDELGRLKSLNTPQHSAPLTTPYLSVHSACARQGTHIHSHARQSTTNSSHHVLLFRQREHHTHRMSCHVMLSSGKRALPLHDTREHGRKVETNEQSPAHSTLKQFASIFPCGTQRTNRFVLGTCSRAQKQHTTPTLKATLRQQQQKRSRQILARDRFSLLPLPSLR